MEAMKDKTFAGKVGSMSDSTAPEGFETREEYLQFIRNNQCYIEVIAETSEYAVNHPSFVVRILANFALSEIKLPDESKRSDPYYAMSGAGQNMSR